MMCSLRLWWWSCALYVTEPELIKWPNICLANSDQFFPRIENSKSFRIHQPVYPTNRVLSLQIFLADHYHTPKVQMLGNLSFATWVWAFHVVLPLETENTWKTIINAVLAYSWGLRVSISAVWPHHITPHHATYITYWSIGNECPNFAFSSPHHHLR